MDILVLRPQRHHQHRKLELLLDLPDPDTVVLGRFDLREPGHFEFLLGAIGGIRRVLVWPQSRVFL